MTVNKVNVHVFQYYSLRKYIPFFFTKLHEIAILNAVRRADHDDAWKKVPFPAFFFFFLLADDNIFN